MKKYREKLGRIKKKEKKIILLWRKVGPEIVIFIYEETTMKKEIKLVSCHEYMSLIACNMLVFSQVEYPQAEKISTFFCEGCEYIFILY